MTARAKGLELDVGRQSGKRVRQKSVHAHFFGFHSLAIRCASAI